MKKLLLGVITFALIITSCNKYADDFAALKDQIAALALQVNGVIQLQADLTAAKAQISALQTAVAALPTATQQTAQFAGVTTSLGTITASLTAITTTLNAVALAGTASKAVVDKLAVDLAKMAADKVIADAALKVTLATLQSDLAKAIVAGNDASDKKTADAIAAAQLKITDAIAASIIATDANVKKQIDAAVVLLNAAITASKDDVNAKLALAKEALEAAIKASKDEIVAAIAAGLLITDAKIDAAKTALDAAILASAATTDGKIATLQTALTELINLGNAATIAKVQLVQDALAAIVGVGDDKTKLSIQGLQLLLAAAQKDISTILVNTSMYNGDVSITTDAEYDFFLAKINQLGIINGNLTVDPATILTAAKKADVNTILARIQAVITTGNVKLTSTAAGQLALPLLTSVKGYYWVIGADVADDALTTVGGYVKYDYDGTYESTSLKNVGGDLILVNKAVVAGVTPLGTNSIKIPNVVVTGNVYDNAALLTPGILTFPLATTVQLSGGVTNLTAAVATTVKLGSAAYPVPGLIITAPLATSVDLSACTSAVGGLMVTTKAAGVVDLSKLATSNAPVTLNGPTTVDFPLWTGGAAAVLTAPNATTVGMAKHEWQVPAVMPAVKWLTLGNVNANVLISAYPTLLTANITGKTQTKWALCAAGVTSAGNANLTGLTLGGVMNTVFVTTTPLLTSVTTTGMINSFTLNNAAIITGLTLGHSHFQGDLGFGGPGSDLTITNNPKLLTLAPTAIDKMKSLTVTGNAVLASFDFSSYKNLILTGAVTIQIGLNKVVGTYVPGWDKFGTTPSGQAVIKSNSILTLKDYVALIKANLAGVTMAAGTWNIDITVNTPAVLLSAAMLANSGAFTAPDVNLVDAFGAISNFNEMGLVVAE